MPACPHCQKDNTEGTLQCVACGAALQNAYRTCPTCQALNTATRTYCQRCFSPLEEHPLHRGVRLSPKRPDASRPAPREGPGVPAARPEPPRDRQTARPVQPQVPRDKGSAPDVPSPRRHTPPPSTPPVRPEESSARSTIRRLGEASLQGQARPRTESDEDVLSALPDALPIEPVFLAQGAVVAPPSRSRTAEASAETAAADLFALLASEHAPLAEHVRLVEPPLVPTPARRRRRLLYLLILLAALIPFVSRGVTSGWLVPHPAVISFVDRIDALPEGQVVLISFDYEPAFSGEMDPLAASLTRRLAERGVPMLAMSSSPAGYGVARETFARLNREREAAGLPALVYGTDYLLLGYLAGQEAGLRSLALGLADAFPQDQEQGLPLGEYPILEGITTLDDVANVYLVSDGQMVVRRWIEQIAGRTGVQLDAMVSAHVEPLLVAYRESGQLSGLLGGATGAAQLERLLGVPGLGTRALDGLLALGLLLGAVVLVASLVALRQRRAASRRP